MLPIKKIVKLKLKKKERTKLIKEKKRKRRQINSVMKCYSFYSTMVADFKLLVENYLI